MEPITKPADQLKKLQKTEEQDQADSCKEAEISDELFKNNEPKKIQITDVSALQKSLTKVSEETECNKDNKQSEVLEKSFELVEEITVQTKEDAEEESEDAAHGSIFVSMWTPWKDTCYYRC